MGESDSRTWKGNERRSAKERRKAQQRAKDRRAAPRADVPNERRSPGDRRAAERRKVPDRRDESRWQSVPIELPATAEAADEAGLLAAATDARTRAHARYSKFKVGAALETDSGEIVSGCNIENATYGLTLCAERVALVKALSDGHAVFTRIAVVADTAAPTPPCGPCRQLLWEYCGDIDIILGNLNGPVGRFRLSALLPLPFDARLLG